MRFFAYATPLLLAGCLPSFPSTGAASDSGLPDVALPAGDASIDANGSPVDASAGRDASADSTAPPGTADAVAPESGANGGVAKDAANDSAPALIEASALDATNVYDAFVEGAPSDGATCDGGDLFCSGTCVDTLSDPNNCAACGHSCASSLGGACINGVCQPFRLSNSGGTQLFIDSANVYPYYTNSFGTFLTSIARADGTVGNSFDYFASFVVAQDAANFYLYETEGTSGTQICQIDKTTMRAVDTCIYPQGNASVAIGVAGTTLWWIDSAHTLWGGTTVGATPTSLDTSAGAVLAADRSGVVWGEQSGVLSVSNSATSTATGTVTHPSGPFTSDPKMVILDATNIYWYNAADGSLYRTARDGTGYAKLTLLANAPGQLAVDSLYVYWTDSAVGVISRIAISGQGSPSQVGTQANVSGVAVDSSAIYWSSYDATGNAGVTYELPK